MTPITLDAHYGRSVTIDVCEACSSLWFDGHELLQLTPGATLAVFTRMGALGDTARRPLGDVLHCPRCQLRLARAVDRQQGTAFEVFRCRREHGRFMTFGAFLRARRFVRDLAPSEVASLAAEVRQTRCLGCGAAVDLGTASACPYCRAPIAVIDPGQLRRTVDELQAAEAARHTLDPAWPLEAARVARQTEAAFASMRQHGRDDASFTLVDDGLSVLWSVVDLIAGGRR